MGGPRGEKERATKKVNTLHILARPDATVLCLSFVQAHGIGQNMCAETPFAPTKRPVQRPLPYHTANVRSSSVITRG